jgi:hypothetical protein
MKRRKAIQTIALGVGGLGLLNYCTSTPTAPSVLEEKDQKLVELLTEAILPAKSEEFPTQETRMEFILNQMGGNLTVEEMEGYKQGLDIFQGLVEQTFLKPYQALDFDTQNYTIQRALGHPGELGFFMRKNRKWSLRHFMTSERYMTEFLNYEFIPNRYLGCVTV